ncbi:MAG: carboxypeptidase regulatory-like domain-containing protein [Terracidiphilus sp.]
MKSIKLAFSTFALGLLLASATAQAAQITGTVTDKTTGKPAAGDTVVLVDPQAGMAEVGHATTDASGHYSLDKPGSGPALVRAMHQGAPYFIAAPEGGAPGDIAVYDVAAKVSGVSIDEDVIGIVQAANGQLQVFERYSVHNSSSPPRTQWSPRSFEIVLPVEAVVDGVSAQRPSGLPTSLSLDPDGPKGHYAFNFPIQPDDGEKSTHFQIEYEVPYSGKFTFHPQVTLPARTVWAMLPKGMIFAAGAGSDFESSPQDPGFQTFVARNAVPGKALEFTVSGSGSLPREDQSTQANQQAASSMGGQDNGGQEAGAAGRQPGGGIGNPIDTPDPLSKYKWWILGGIALVMVASAALLLRKPGDGTAVGYMADPRAGNAPPAKQTALLNALKEELFALESEKIAGTLAAEEYAKVKAALETVLRRALKRQ